MIDSKLEAGLEIVEYNEYGGGALLQLSWLRPGGAWAAVPAAQLYPAAAGPAN